MGILRPTDVGKLVERVNATYQKGGKCTRVASKIPMQALVLQLRSYTAQVQAEADAEGLTTDTNIAQWATDLASWQQRLEGYQAALDAATKESGIESCEELYPTVIGPLLDGNFHGTTNVAGIANPAVPTVPDVATPYMLANQVQVYRQFQAEKFEALINYLLAEAKAVKKKIIRAAKVAAPKVGLIIVGAAAVAAAVGYASSEISKGRSA